VKTVIAAVMPTNAAPTILRHRSSMTINLLQGFCSSAFILPHSASKSFQGIVKVRLKAEPKLASLRQNQRRQTDRGDEMC
jgi:hypothetical protein